MGAAAGTSRGKVRHEQGKQHGDRVLVLELPAATGPALLSDPDTDPEQDLKVQREGVDQHDLSSRPVCWPRS
jgi:hypothetical protein